MYLNLVRARRCFRDYRPFDLALLDLLGGECQNAAETHAATGLPEFMLPQLDDMLTDPCIGKHACSTCRPACLSAHNLQ